MNFYLIAVESKTPKWVAQGFNQYAQRLPKHCSLELIEIRAQSRRQGNLDRIRREEARRMRERIPPGGYVIALAESGKPFTTQALAERVDGWMQSGVDVALLVGGADGLDPACIEQAHECWSLSALTFPHALVRVIVAEQIYRAWTILSNHPYHRD